MKKRRIARGCKALAIPKIPNKETFCSRFFAHYGFEANTWIWGYVSAETMYKIVGEVCGALPPSAIELNDVTLILGTLELLE